MAGNKLKIAHIVTRMDWGGAPDVLRTLCEWTKDDYDITLITGPNVHLSESTKRFLERFKEHTVTIPQLHREINPFWDFCALIGIIRIIYEKKFDIVHTHTSKAGIIGRLAARLCGVKKIIHTPHGHIFYGYFGALTTKIFIAVEKLAAFFTDTIITLTCREKNDMLRLRVAATQKIKVIPLGIDTNELPAIDDTTRALKRETLKLNKNDIAIGMVSRLEEIKGPRYFIEAAAGIKDPRVKFIIAGDGSLNSTLQKLAGALNVPIQFYGWRADALEIIAALDILVQPSLNEGLSLTIVQAAFFKTPVIASCAGGIPEIIRDDITGILVAPRDTQAITQAVTKLIDSPQDRRRLAENAYLQAKNYFTAEKMVQAVKELYNS